jgi:hypothetical protein
MRTKIVAAFLAGGLLIGAGLATAAISTPGTAQAQDETDDSEARDPVSRIIGVLGQVLDDLVGDGTITQDQADAIVEATEEKIDELEAEHRARHERLSEFLDDGVITAEEASELPDDHWIFDDALADAWDDGELTTEEIRDIHPFRRGHDLRRGFGFGALLDDGGIDQEEYDSLDDDHPLKQIDVSEYLADGLITPDEFRDLFADLRDSFHKDA